MGLVASMYDESFPPKSKFNVKDIPDLSGKVIIVTGANAGVGRETAKALLSHNAKVYVACRSKDKAVQALRDLKAATGKEGIFLKMDLADLHSIKAAAEEFLSKEKELHVLFNNAGVMIPPIDMLTAQGYDLQFGTNVLGHFYFTNLLLPALLAGAASSPDGKARVVNTSSSASYVPSDVDFNVLKPGPARTKMGTIDLYALSKFGNVLFSNQLAKRYGDKGIISTSLNPGNLKSDLQRHASAFQRFLIAPLLKPVAFGALTQLWAGTSPEGTGFNGKYLIPWARIGKANKAASNEKLGEAVWRWCEEQVVNI